MFEEGYVIVNKKKEKQCMPQETEECAWYKILRDATPACFDSERSKALKKGYRCVPVKITFDWG